MSIYPHEDQFLEEVFGLFTLEAQEWIAQCKAALEELERQPPGDRQAKLYETIICGVTNLGGSAATVELPTLEKLAFALVPLLQRMRELGPRSPGEQRAALHEGLDAITQAIKHLEETKSGTVPGLAPVLQRLSDAEHLPAEHAANETEVSFPSSQHRDEPAVIPCSPGSLLDDLRNLERTRSEATDQTRHIVETVIKKVKNESGTDQNGSHVDASTIVQILQDLEARDEQFLEEIRRRLPAIEAVLLELKSDQEGWGSSPRAAGALQDIHLLHETARALEAKAIMLFFHGLQTFLGIVSRQEVSVLPQRLDAVSSRLRCILPLAEKWVDVGKHERTSVQKVVRP
ncbi:MAG: hypothetical protein ACREJU_10625 [Nitrospiraceae bacterium]